MMICKKEKHPSRSQAAYFRKLFFATVEKTRKRPGAFSFSSNKEPLVLSESSISCPFSVALAKPRIPSIYKCNLFVMLAHYSPLGLTAPGCHLIRKQKHCLNTRRCCLTLALFTPSQLSPSHNERSLRRFHRLSWSSVYLYCSRPVFFQKVSID